jgi:DNA-nicking Smr family endonuclease
MRIRKWLKRFTSEGQESPAQEFESDSSDPFDPFPEPVEIEVKDVIDLHTIPPRDVKAVVQEYLIQANEKGFRSVRIIHGKGIGVQREMVRSLLAKTPFVADWTDAPPEAGGLGATIVRLDEPQKLTE